MVVVGTPRVSVEGLIRSFDILAICCAIAALISALSSRRGADTLVPFAVGTLFLSLALIGVRFARKHLGILADKRIVWCAHPGGISVRQGRSVEFIARANISSIDASESLVGEMTVLGIIRRRGSLKGMLGSTPYLYLRGTGDERRAIVAELKRTIGAE